MKSKLRPFSFLFLLTLITAASPVVAAERVVLDWSGVPAGEAPPVRLEFTDITTKGEAKLLVIDDKTSPISLFPKGAHGLYIKSPVENSVGISTALGTEGVLKGWVEMDVALGARSFAINLVQRKDPSAAPVATRVDGNTVAFVFLRPNMSTLLRAGGSGKTMMVLPKIPENTLSKVRIAWDFTVTPPALTLTVNGEAGLDENGQPATLPLADIVNTSAGIDYLRLTPIDGMLGNIRVSE